MKQRLIALYAKELFRPGLLGFFINPFFIIRRGLFRGIRHHAPALKGRMLDFGCGEKPYRDLFQVDEYIGVDIAVSGHGTEGGQVDVFYDGRHIPFADAHFDAVLASEVFEHVFNLDEIMGELHRVMRPGARMLITAPFGWDEHEKPYDFARYTCFAWEAILRRHGFRVIEAGKNGHYITAVTQLWIAYLFQHILPKRPFLRILLNPLLIAPWTLLGLVMGAVLPKNRDLYLNNVLLVERV